MFTRTIALLLGAVLAPALASVDVRSVGRDSIELHAIADLSLSTLEAPAIDPSNRWADDPTAVSLGHRLFFDPRLSASGAVSCASCHEPSRDFQDGIPLGKGVGTTERRTMPIAGTAYAPFLFWDGRKDS